jgi:predicted DNA-binding protein
MPAARPRMHVTPSEQVHRLLAEISKVTGKPPATMVRELLDEAIPALEMTLEAFRSIQARPEEAQAAVARMAAKAHAQIAQVTLNLDTNQKPGRKPGGKKGRGAAKT